MTIFNLPPQKFNNINLYLFTIKKKLKKKKDINAPPICHHLLNENGGKLKIVIGIEVYP